MINSVRRPAIGIVLLVVGVECLALWAFWRRGDHIVHDLNAWVITQLHGQEMIDDETAAQQQAARDAELARRGVREAVFCFVCRTREATEIAYYTDAEIEMKHCSACTPPVTILSNQIHHQPYGHVDSSGVRIFPEETIRSNDISDELRFLLVFTLASLGSFVAVKVTAIVCGPDLTARSICGVVATAIICGQCLWLAYR